MAGSLVWLPKPGVISAAPSGGLLYWRSSLRQRAAVSEEWVQEEEANVISLLPISDVQDDLVCQVVCLL